jgi:hypothetical protein
MSCSACQEPCDGSNKVMFHTIMLALALTGLLMASSAEDLGSAGPVIISLGIFVVFFAMISEALHGLLFVVRLLSRRYSASKENKEVE